MDVVCIYMVGNQKLITASSESDPHPDIVAHPNIEIVPLRPHPAFLQTSNKILFTICGPLKVLFQIFYLWKCLAYVTTPSKWLLVQVFDQTPSKVQGILIPSIEPSLNSYSGCRVSLLLLAANTAGH